MGISERLENKLLEEVKSVSEDIYKTSKLLYERGHIKRWIYDYIDSIYHFRIPDIFEDAIEFHKFCQDLDNIMGMYRHRNLLSIIPIDSIIHMSSYAIVTKKWLEPLSKAILNEPTSKILEVACGNGMIAKGLKDYGVDIIATNQGYSIGDDYSIHISRPWIDDIEKIDAIQAIEKYGSDVDYVLLSWPPACSTIDLEILKAMRRVNPFCCMILIGEEDDNRCTGSREFFNEAIPINFGFMNSEYKEWYEEAQNEYVSRFNTTDRILFYR